MTSFLNNINVGGLLNPFSTKVGELIEKATDSNLASEDWGLILEICDLINGSEDGPRDAIKAIRKRLQQSAGKNYKTVIFTLILLEACVKNCDRKFHVLVCSKDFVQELFKLIGPKNDPPRVVQDKVLGLIQSWADAFYNQPDMVAVVHMYKELKAKGIEFPMTDLDSMAPIHTPRKTVPSEMSPAKSWNAQANERPASHSAQPDVVDSTAASGDDAVRLNQDQLAKLRSELDVVQENMTVLNEMLTELIPGKEHPSDLELLTQLYGTCKAMQVRLVELISQLSNNEVTADLLRMNDLLNNLFLRYNRFEKNRMARTSQKAGPETGEVASLIDLEIDDENTNNKLVKDFNKLSMQNKNNGSSSLESSRQKSEPDFDMFAQSRGASYENSKKEGSTYEDNLKASQMAGGLNALAQSRSQPPSMMHRESDFDEMAAWLGEQSSTTEPDSLTSSEFDRFLAERAAAAENIPNEQPTNNSSPSRRNVTQRNKRSNEDMYAI